MRWFPLSLWTIVASVLLVFGASEIGVSGASSLEWDREGRATVKVAGSGVDGLSTALIHSKETTPSGMTQRSTEIIELNGDLKGRVLYHVTSVFDFVKGTLVNTGDEVFSGTVAGSAPVMIHDDQFRFEVNLNTGQESGQVYLYDHIEGPKVRCKLEVVGTGMTPDGNPMFDYRGECTFRDR